MPHTQIQEARDHHPCFYAEDKGAYGRIHLPVAPSCNIQCAYCRRDHDCVHENRPGVTKGVITPRQALNRLELALEKMPHISVAGIAGPGDAFSEPDLTLETFELIRGRMPGVSLCVSTNGLNVKGYIPELLELNVRFITVTVNAINPDLGACIYKKVMIEGKAIQGREAAQRLINRQLETISLLKARDFTVKVNSVVIPGVNDDHILFMAKKMGSMGVDIMNLLPIIPLPETDMEGIKPPDASVINKLRRKAGAFLPQMSHCSRCRSDAVGLLREDKCGPFEEEAGK